MARTKEVYPTEEIPHLWAHQDTNGLEYARNPGGNLYFREKTIYSYGSHFPIASFVEQGAATAVLFNVARASMTTSRQQNLVRDAIPPQYSIFDVPLGNFDVDASIYSYLAGAADLRRRIEKAKAAKGDRLAELEDLTKQANEFARFFGREPIFAEDAHDRETEYFQSLIRLAREAADQRNKQRQRLLEAEKQATIKRWLNGEDVWFPQGVNKVFLRIKGDQVETSRGVAFPVKDAGLALKLVEHAHENKMAILPSDVGRSIRRLGDHRIDKIDEHGNVWAGCHYVTYEEIARIAPALKGERS